MADERIPRMRTAAKIVADLKALDPDTEVTEFFVRKLAQDGVVPVVWAGRKKLMDEDLVFALLRQGTARPVKEAPAAVGGIRRIDPKH